jgi:hypothetical protein
MRVRTYERSFLAEETRRQTAWTQTLLPDPSGNPWVSTSRLRKKVLTLRCRHGAGAVSAPLVSSYVRRRTTHS